MVVSCFTTFLECSAYIVALRMATKIFLLLDVHAPAYNRAGIRSFCVDVLEITCFRLCEKVCKRITYTACRILPLSTVGCSRKRERYASLLSTLPTLREVFLRKSRMIALIPFSQNMILRREHHLSHERVMQHYGGQKSPCHLGRVHVSVPLINQIACAVLRGSCPEHVCH